MPANHSCLHEVDLAVMRQTQEYHTKMLEKSTSSIEDIHKLLKGNNGQGLMTQQALLAQGLKRLWWWVGGVSMSLLGIAVYVIRKAF